jgi:hypothetical protein
MDKVQNGYDLKCNTPLSEPCKVLLGIATPSLARGVLAVILLSIAGENTDFYVIINLFLSHFACTLL